AGLERMTSVLQSVHTVYDIDSFAAIMKAIAQISGHRYGGDMSDELDTASRVICDHCRSSTFLVSDGVTPSNEGRGYVLRKIMRRAMSHGRLLGAVDPFLFEMANTVSDLMGEAYPELRGAVGSRVPSVVLAEEKRFANTL